MTHLVWAFHVFCLFVCFFKFSKSLIFPTAQMEMEKNRRLCGHRSLGGCPAETHRNMAMHVALQCTGQIEHLGFQALQDLRTENGKSEYLFWDPHQKKSRWHKMSLTTEKTWEGLDLLLDSWGRWAEPLLASLWRWQGSPVTETGCHCWSPSAGTWRRMSAKMWI